MHRTRYPMMHWRTLSWHYAYVCCPSDSNSVRKYLDMTLYTLSKASTPARSLSVILPMSSLIIWLLWCLRPWPLEVCPSFGDCDPSEHFVGDPTNDIVDVLCKCVVVPLLVTTYLFSCWVTILSPWMFHLQFWVVTLPDSLSCWVTRFTNRLFLINKVIWKPIWLSQLETRPGENGLWLIQKSWWLCIPHLQIRCSRKG